jgi:oligoribonuclease NrnB/cAMP/cGMP phosphodiesterase (DHH superfamily)
LATPAAGAARPGAKRRASTPRPRAGRRAAGGRTAPGRGAGTVHIVSHGPHCLDGVAAAVAVARFHAGARIIPDFSGNADIDRILQNVAPRDARGYELWITDISWREKETDRHLRALAERGVRIYWFDHHRTALARYRAGEIDVPFADHVVREDFAASRLVYEYLERRRAAEGRPRPAFRAFAPIVAMADDNDRWLHRISGSRELALVVRVLGADSYEELLHLGRDAHYTPRMEHARRQIERELARSFETAAQTRTERLLPDGTTLVAALCEGHPSEVADRWGKQARRTVFALYDAKSLAVSLRRSPDCEVDLSAVAERLGGGGHAAAAGCELPELRRLLAGAVADLVEEAVARGKP